MDQLRQALATVQVYLGQLTTVHKLLIGSLCVIVLMSMFLVSQYAGQSAMVEFLPGASAEEQQRAAAFLTQRGIAYQATAAGVMVPPSQRDMAFAQYAASGSLPDDKATLFRNMIERQKWYNTKQQNEQIYNDALQNELARTISNFPGVKSATVMISAPERQGLGAIVQRPTATVAVFTESGQPLDQAGVDAIAGFVAGARAGLDLQRVAIIDGTGRRQRKASNPDDVIAGTYLEHATKVETLAREKLSELLSYIPGVVVAVTAQVDVTRSTQQATRYFKSGDGTVSMPRKEVTDQTSTIDGSGAAEPGVRSNAALDVNSGGGAGGSSSTQKNEESEFENHVGSSTEAVVDPKGMPTMVAVSVNVPRSYVAAVLAQTAAPADPNAAGGGAAGGAAGGGGAAGPSDAELADRFEKEIKPKITESLLPHIRAMTQMANAGVDAEQLRTMLMSQVNVAMIPLDVPVTVGASSAGLLSGVFGGGSGGGGGGGLLGSDLIEKGLLAGLSLLAMGLMVAMVKKSSKKVEMPTAEEIVGVPAKLEPRNDMIGEADETDTPMAGIEVGEDEVRSQKMLEQVAELVKDSPESAARMLNRWIQVET